MLLSPNPALAGSGKSNFHFDGLVMGLLGQLWLMEVMYCISWHCKAAAWATAEEEGSR